MGQLANGHPAERQACPACGAEVAMPFYEVADVPVHLVQLVASQAEALDCRCGDIRLWMCRSCAMTWNEAFDPTSMHYEESYESTQTVSPTFNRFHERLARELVQRFDLAGKDVLEIGCGQGEFLHLLCDLGIRRGIGFDPAVAGPSERPNVTLVRDNYGDAARELRPDFICSKMTLEHIAHPGRFLQGLRRTVGDRSETVVFVMVPELTRILRLAAFWEVYYEHCAYFSPGALARAFRAADFQVVDLWLDYDDQYLLIAARPRLCDSVPFAREESPGTLTGLAKAFATRVRHDQQHWQSRLRERHRHGRRTALWGAGSRGVAFLTTLGLTDEVAFAVDINPRRQGTFIAGSGQPIVGPDALVDAQPDLILVMSPIYSDEIRAALRARGLSPHIVSVEDGPAAI